MNDYFRKARRLLGIPFVAGLALGTIGTSLGAGLLGSSVFPDVKSGSYYDEAIGELYRNGVITGFGDGRFGPDEPVTRGQIAVMLKRFHDKLESGEWESGDVTTSSRSSRARSSSSESSSSSSSSVASSSSLSFDNSNPKGNFRFTSGGFSAGENLGRINISVVRTGKNEGAASVSYSVKAGTAIAGTDFTVASGSLTFAAKESSKIFSVTLLDDTLAEGDETFTVTLSNPTNGAGLANPATATATVIDNETSNSSSSTNTTAYSSSSIPPQGAITFGAPAYSVSESGPTVTITVNRVGGSTGDVSVGYATANGTATSNIDYTPTSGTLTFASGETSKTFTVAIINNAGINGSKMFNVTLATPTGSAVLGEHKAATVSIVDDESQTFGSGSLKFAKASYSVQQSTGMATVTVQRLGGTVGTATVSYSTNPGNASAGIDYTHTQGTLTFAPGEAAKTINVPLLKSTTGDNERSLFVVISSPVNTALGDPTSTTVTIFR